MKPATCTIDGCDKPVRVERRGWCVTHYNRWRTLGDPLAVVRHSVTFDLAPLIRYLELTLPDLTGRIGFGEARCGFGDGRHKVVDAQIAEALGANKRQVQRWRHGTLVDHVDADRLAVRCGLHPANVWPDWYELVSA